MFPYVGEKKLGTVITPDTWKDGARNTTGNLSKVQQLAFEVLESDLGT